MSEAMGVPQGWEKCEETPTLGEIVAVLWMDAYGDDDGAWHAAKSTPAYSPARCISVGKLIQCDTTVVALTPHWTVSPDEVTELEGGRVVIPAGCVVTILSFSGAVEELTTDNHPEVNDAAQTETEDEAKAEAHAGGLLISMRELLA